MKKIAVVLCGSGYKDGSEIRESVAVLWGLETLGAQWQCFAPDAPQCDVINCLTGATLPESRNQMVEAARIARGQVAPLASLKAADYDGIILPGGFGAAKNLCNFAFKGMGGEVIPSLKQTLQDFHRVHKPIGAVCIAPAILALAFKGQPLELSVGAECEASRAITGLGHKHIVTQVNECHVDLKNKVVTTPAYMYDNAKLDQLFEGVRRLVGAVVELT
ncbi:MAG: isoprenoid biosynthesis glyoxalase ElbB [Deltaproteobacteria bacterium]|nr:isoprenoid biosynthesis glyoxalase ElbB [Deltaproteobacteria bacterium]MBI3296148.1 isoprenoid biosynthesis glyoxalase ElbB [Deltaproteobacteria bacterium]